MNRYEKAKRVLPFFWRSFSGVPVILRPACPAANDSVVLTIISNSDINPVIRFYAMKENGFDKGGPL